MQELARIVRLADAEIVGSVLALVVEAFYFWTLALT